MNRYLYLSREFAQISLKEAAAHRIDFIFGLINSITSITISLIVLNFMFQHNQRLAGWQIAEVIVIIGLFRLLKAIMDTFVAPNLRNLQQSIRNGGLDFILLKPVDPQFYVSFQKTEIWNGMSIIVAIIAIIYGIIIHEEIVPIVGIILFLLAVLSATLLLYSIWLLVMASTFWLIDTTNLSNIVTTGTDFAQFPIQVYPHVLQFLFTFIFPIAFFSTVPASILFTPGDKSFEFLLLSIIVTTIFFFLSRIVWMSALKKYTSVNS